MINVWLSRFFYDGSAWTRKYSSMKAYLVDASCHASWCIHWVVFVTREERGAKSISTDFIPIKCSSFIDRRAELIRERIELRPSR